MVTCLPAGRDAALPHFDDLALACDLADDSQIRIAKNEQGRGHRPH
jgi:hypothetical protein